ncbi:MAG: PadR family transcriptional regulator [Chloroflexota bacterium]
MSKNNNIEKYLPLSESTYYILLMLVEPLHGYGVMQEVATMTDGEVVIGPGTLYGAFTTLQKENLIGLERMEGRRKFYTLTNKGRAVLRCQIERLEKMNYNGQQVLARLDDSA